MLRTNTAKWYPKYKRWQINVQKNGKRKSFVSHVKGRQGQRICNQKADEWLESNINNSSMKVAKLVEMFIEEKEINVGTSRLATIKSRFKVWILPAIGNKPISKITEQDLQNILNTMYRSDRSKSMIDGTRRLLCELMRFARKNNLSTLNPEFLYTPKKAKRKEERRALTINDLNILFTSDKTMLYEKEVYDDYINHYRFAVATGLRRGELLGLKWDDIDENIIHVRRSLNQEREFTDGKTTNACRDIPMTQLARNILKEVPKQSEFVFFTGHSPVYVSFRFKSYAKYNGLSADRFHELRHTFITLMDSVVPINVLKNVVGHSEKMDTVGIYGHENDREMEIAKSRIDRQFSEIIGI